MKWFLVLLLLCSLGLVFTDQREYQTTSLSSEDSALLHEYTKGMQTAIERKEGTCDSDQIQFTKDRLVYKHNVAEQYTSASNPYYVPLGSDTLFGNEWVNRICPEVVHYYTHVPYFDSYRMDGQVPLLTTQAAMGATCLLRLVNMLCLQIGAQWTVWSGSALGAILHSGPIPWDDDIDIIIDANKKDEFFDNCNKFKIGNVQMKCFQDFNSIKLSVSSSDGQHFFPHYRDEWDYPNLDVFCYKLQEDGTHFKEVYSFDANDGKNLQANMAKEITLYHDVFPTRQYFFGGILLPGPRAYIRDIYNTSICRSGGVNHRQLGGVKSRLLCCGLLSPHFPFTLEFDSVSNTSIHYEVVVVGSRPVHISLVDKEEYRVLKTGYLLNHRHPSNVQTHEHVSFIPTDWYEDEAMKLSLGLRIPLPLEDKEVYQQWHTSIEQRKEWFSNEQGRTGQQLSQLIPHLDQAEIDNSISSKASPSFPDRLRVVVLNAQRGRQWLLIALKLKLAPELQHADIVILNEMDLGMARSSNEHTTRLLAHALKMNYAYGVEFVELTNGDKEEQGRTAGRNNTLGLHGNAILSRFPLSNPFIVRQPLEEAYFSDQATFVNAQGYERRLGGRMGLIAHTTIALKYRNITLSIGSVHKISHLDYPRIAEDIHSEGVDGAIFGGDQDPGMCAGTSSENMDIQGQSTWRASCETLGGTHGDVVCSSQLQPHGGRINTLVLLPCFDNTVSRVSLGDHAIMVTDFAL